MLGFRAEVTQCRRRGDNARWWNDSRVHIGGQSGVGRLPVHVRGPEGW